MSVAIQKLDDVESVKVSLNDGTATVVLEPGNSLDPERLRKVARDSGFTPKQARVSVVGRLVGEAGVAILEVGGPNLRYVLAEHRNAAGQLEELTSNHMGEDVVVHGELPERPSESDKARLLRIVSFSSTTDTDTPTHTKAW